MNFSSRRSLPLPHERCLLLKLEALPEIEVIERQPQAPLQAEKERAPKMLFPAGVQGKVVNMRTQIALATADIVEFPFDKRACLPGINRPLVAGIDGKRIVLCLFRIKFP